MLKKIHELEENQFLVACLCGLQVSADDLKVMQGLPANFVNAGPSLLPGGFAPGDMVFALRDIVVQTEGSGTAVAVGSGDVGIFDRI